MGQATQLRLLIIAFLALPFFFGGCKLEETLLPTDPTGDDAVAGEDSTIGGSNGSSSSSDGITAPIISDPLSGSTVSDAQPTLTVLNSAQSGGGAPTYLFQVSTEASFATLEAQSIQIPEGQDGTTSWRVDRALADGRYFWRVRSRSGTVDSDFSATAEFTVGAGGPAAPPPDDPDPPPPSAGTIVSDPLTGGSIGDVAGGQFTSAGWRITSPGNFIRYEVPPMQSGWVEFDVQGLRESNPSPDQFMLFGMWDPSAGAYRTNRFRVHLQKLHPNPHNPPYLRLRWIANGEQHDEGNNFLVWAPSRVYTFRIEWGPSGAGHTANVYLDGQRMITVNYSRAYRPNVLYIELGIGERGESIVGATYSNLRIGN